MPKNKKFWDIPGATAIESQEDLLKYLLEHDELKSAIYYPNLLTREDESRIQRIEGKCFSKVSFSKTEIRHIIFRDCLFQDCLLIGSNIIKCEFHGCRFVRTNTHKIQITESYIDPSSFRRCLNPSEHQNIGVHLFQVLLNNSRDEEQIEFEREAQFLFLRWKRFQEKYELKKNFQKAKSMKEYWKSIISASAVARRFLWEKLFGCGIRIRYFLRTVLIVLVLATVYNFTFKHELGLMYDGEIITNWVEAYYFTVVSLTTLGYGDITPTTDFGKFSAACQSVLGFFIFALLASMLFRRVTP